jgi:hypothetical protein
MHTYDLIGAILYHSYHYIFARTTGKHVDYIYDDDKVYKGRDAETYMAKKKMSLAVDGVVFLYERDGTEVGPRVEKTSDWDDADMSNALRNSMKTYSEYNEIQRAIRDSAHPDPLVVDLSSDEEDKEAKKKTKRPNRSNKNDVVLLYFGSIVRQASAGTLISLRKKYRTHRSQ